MQKTLETDWPRVRGRVVETWSKLTDDDLTAINGKRETLVGKIKDRYGSTPDAIEKEVKAFETKYLAGV
jgi:uncharacterized protein YjbJ (UPF0337 family)